MVLDHHHYRPLIEPVITLGDPALLLLIPTIKSRIKLAADGRPTRKTAARIPASNRSRRIGDRHPGWRRWIVPIALAASVVVALGLYLPERRESNRLARALAISTGELTSLRDSLSVMRQAARVLQASISMNGHEDGLLIFADDISHRWNVVVHGAFHLRRRGAAAPPASPAGRQP